MRLCKLRKNYFTISTVPPAASMAVFAFSLTAFTLKVSLAFQFTIAQNLYTDQSG